MIRPRSPSSHRSLSWLDARERGEKASEPGRD
jgi:hypothetical protein